MVEGFSNLAWGFPWTDKCGGLCLMVFQRVGHNLAIEHAYTAYGTENKG